MDFLSTRKGSYAGPFYPQGWDYRKIKKVTSYGPKQFAERNPAAIIPNAHGVVFNGDFDLFSVPHDELIDRVVDDLFEQNVNPVVIVTSIPGPANIHTGSGANMLQR